MQPDRSLDDIVKGMHAFLRRETVRVVAETIVIMANRMAAHVVQRDGDGKPR